MNTLDLFKERFNQFQSENSLSALSDIRQNAFNTLNQLGIPTFKHEEWKYTRIGGVFNKEHQIPVGPIGTSFTPMDLNPIRLPGHEQAVNNS